VTGNIHDMFYTDALHSRNIASAENRWGGPNRAGYGNPAVDGFSEKLAVTIDPAERLNLHRGMVAQVMGDAALIPLFWEQGPVLALKGIRGIKGSAENMNTWNIFEWDRD
jgi:ABC-type transport system substrate-binding protein